MDIFSNFKVTDGKNQLLIFRHSAKRYEDLMDLFENINVSSELINHEIYHVIISMSVNY